jgi:hypothetical protein
MSGWLAKLFHMDCNSTTREGIRCRNLRLPWSRYCYLHQDLSLWVGVIFFFLSTLVSVGILLYQERRPEIDVRCVPDEKGEPSKLICTVANNGRAEARDFMISFNRLLPLDTHVTAAPELAIRIQESSSPPDPLHDPETAKLLTAFIIHIPRVVAGDPISFTVLTANADNLRAAKQVLRLREEIRDVLTKFGDRLKNAHPEDARRWELQNILSARVKLENFYAPDKFSYERGRYPVKFLTEAEILALAVNQDLYARYKKEFIDIYQGRPSYKAPVIRIRAEDRDAAYVINPPYLNICSIALISLEELKAKKKARGRFHIPESYDDPYCTPTSDPQQEEIPD